ncbi:hypothetical protein GGTG_10099 [Gaeumannomyces tritici R3-111a-1]|uniref:Uncharacterized protein n=1 Tax=Gaeumannomyces tritici (strain R3-111a-1) TaxID=644352 RepID=J3P9B6_GAET3|nr:hypothetical protein GGTG_10099 [Gaeumannomyces tritici R3-111a-1]EJT73252.1 hypothetical protein GGTG_10099 [Gaeumannomyces tritici R3-111a-1]
MGTGTGIDVVEHQASPPSQRLAKYTDRHHDRGYPVARPSTSDRRLLGSPQDAGEPAPVYGTVYGRTSRERTWVAVMDTGGQQKEALF